MAILDFLTGGDPRDRFARQFMARLRKHGWRDGMTYDRAKFAVVLSGEAGTMYLGNVFNDWLTYPRGQRDAALDIAVRPAFEAKDDESFEDAALQLLPVIRNRSHVERLHLDPNWRAEDDAGRSAMGDFCRPLAVLLAVDRPTSMAYVTHEMSHRWGKTFDELLAIALDNLRARSVVEFERAPEGFFLSRYNDYYDASRLLLPHVFEALPLNGRPVTVALSRACVAVAGSDDVPALIELARFIDEAMNEETRPIAFAPLILSDGEWQPFEPMADELAEILALSVKQRLWDYSGQTQLLQDYMDQRGEEVFVSPLDNVYDDDRIRTWTSWAQGVTTLLPRADVIGLRTEAGAALVRRWEDFEDICGPFSPEKDIYPVRYRVERWPSQERWTQLAEREPVSWFPE